MLIVFHSKATYIVLLKKIMINFSTSPNEHREKNSGVNGSTWAKSGWDL